ncbi:uncharacterized protein JCM10292_002766 [Rhodotorula paludigena]|uniref:uncharacterized protein n=1 Tax=Rhodotorula paludigena TaxID=86838 RepID=UPI00318033D4
MQPRRRRERSTLSEWPALSLLAVYRDMPILAGPDASHKLDDAALEAAKVLVFAAPLEREPPDAARRNRIMGTVLGVAAFARTSAPPGAPPVRAVHSSRRRMVWVEAEPGYYVHASIALPRAGKHARRASSATASSAASSAAPAFSLDDDVLVAELRQAYREYRLRYGSLQGTLEKEGKDKLVQALAEYWTEWVERWQPGQGGTPSPIDRVLDAVPRCSLLTPHTSAQLFPLLTQFAASNPSALPTLLHDATVLSLPVLAFPQQTEAKAEQAASSRPAAPPLTEGDLLALVRYLHRLVPPSRQLAVASDPSALSGSSSALAASSSNAWSSSLSTLTNGMSSLLAPRPLALSMPSLPPLPGLSGSSPSPTPSSGEAKKGSSLRAGFAALRRQEKDAAAERRNEEDKVRAAKESEQQAALGIAGAPVATGGDGGGWSLRNVSWSKLGFGGASAPAPAQVARAEAEAATLDASGETAGDRAADTVPVEPAPEGAAQEPAGGAPADVSEPTTPAVELAPAVDADELAEAIGATPGEEQKQVEIVSAHAVAEVAVECEPLQSTEARQKVFELYCGEGAHRDTRIDVRRYERGLLTLALVMLPKTDEAALAWLDSRAERLLEAVETLLEVVHPPAPTYPSRHLVKHGALVASFSPPEPDNANSSSENDLSTTAALLDSYRSLHSSPAVLESLTRLSTTPWVLHRRSDDPSFPSLSSAAASSSPTDAYAVLAGRNSKGKEASLVDAADEIKKLLAVYRTP